MTTDFLSLARRRVRAYAEESDELIRAHREAMSCWDCQEHLQLGIAALRWLRSAEEKLRQADYAGKFSFDGGVREAFDTLYASWLDPCEFAEAWVAELATIGHAPDNLMEFREACREVQEIVQHRDWANKASESRVLCGDNEPW